MDKLNNEFSFPHIPVPPAISEEQYRFWLELRNLLIRKLFASTMVISGNLVVGGDGRIGGSTNIETETVLGEIPCLSYDGPYFNKYRLPASGVFGIADIYAPDEVPIKTEDGRTGARSKFYSVSTSGVKGYVDPYDDTGAPTYILSSTEELILPMKFALEFYARLKSGSTPSVGGYFVTARHSTGDSDSDFSLEVYINRNAFSDYVDQIAFIVKSVEHSPSSSGIHNHTKSWSGTEWHADDWAKIRIECDRVALKSKIYLNDELLSEQSFEYDFPETDTVRIGSSGSAIGHICLMDGPATKNGAQNAMISEFKLIQLS